MATLRGICYWHHTLKSTSKTLATLSKVVGTAKSHDWQSIAAPLHEVKNFEGAGGFDVDSYK